jgi:hypothetical protein
MGGITMITIKIDTAITKHDIPHKQAIETQMVTKLAMKLLEIFPPHYRFRDPNDETSEVCEITIYGMSEQEFLLMRDTFQKLKTIIF